tara:strand:+ start:55 stop:918 length:864 start_codon:yes stop_codon:yes gene_type:complete
MTSFVPPTKNAAWEFGMSLFSRANTQLFQSSPTLAVGDVKISKDGGAFADTTGLPGVVGVQVIVSLTAAETNADRIYLTFMDQAGAEWTDAAINMYTVARNIDSLAYPATPGTNIENAVWDATTAAHVTPGTFGLAVANSGDPWSTSLAGAYSVGQAGYILVNYLDAAVSSRLPTANISLDASGRVDLGKLVGDTAAASYLSRASNALATGTASTGCTTTSITTSTVSPTVSTQDQFAGRLLTFTSDTGTIALRGAMASITTNTNGGTFTISALPVVPSSGDTFVIT